MKKAFLSLFFIFVFTNYFFAGPFGFSEGMTYEQVKEACGGREPVKISDGTYIVVPVKQHPYFVRYIAWIDENAGLNYLKAIGKNIDTNSYGFEIKSKFDSLETSLCKTYGKCERTDILMPGSIWDDYDEWMRALEKRDRYLMSSWSSDKGSKMPDDLKGIYLAASADSYDSGKIILEYEFSNHESVENAQKEIEDSVF